MAYDYTLLFDCIINAVASDGPVAERMQSVIDECARQRPHADWEELSRIDFAGDASALQSWLQRAFPSADGTRAYAGLWFGLFNPAKELDEATADIYVGASADFDADSLNWTGNIDGLELENYLQSTVLDAIYTIAYRSEAGLGNDAEYPLALAYGGIAVHSLLAQVALPAPLQNLQGAALGFDSGDFLFLGDFSAAKFISHVRAG